MSEEEEIENRALIVRGNYDLTVPERALIERGLLLAETIGKKDYICPILGAKFILIPAGTFMMGSPEDEPDRYDDETLHEVTISKPFFMQTTPVTKRQWKKVMGNKESYYAGDENLPADYVSWHNVQKFIRKINKTEGIKKYRLPTEAEWEYACRAGGIMSYCFGANPSRLHEYAWCFEKLGCDHRHSVGQKMPNAWGMYDMHGNVWEWCQDRHGDYPPGSVTDPVGPSKGRERVSRGGSWFNHARLCRSAIRGYCSPYDMTELRGFRLIRIC
ncbi:MAG: formylglycine-generating enzyme family protein [Anaerolineaceae bacterium]|nr:formylglycine-generating enzyme family protein [Anaerolineaceae bacterium]